MNRTSIIVAILIIIWVLVIIAMVITDYVVLAGACTALMGVVLYDRYKK